MTATSKSPLRRYPILADPVVGAGDALALTQILSGVLFQVRPTDPPTFLATGLLLVAIALVACLLPARRASGVDPMVSLRSA